MSAGKSGAYPHAPRAHPRALVEPQVPLHCVADAAGLAPFEAAVVDISEGGVGITCSSEINLVPGTMLRGCRIGLPDGRTVKLELEVRYARPTTLDTGRPALRAGCRIVDPATSLLELVKRYMDS